MNTVYLKSDITFEPDCNYMLKIRIDVPNQRIFYIKKSTLECTFDQACQNPEDPTCLHYLDSEGNFYLGKAGLGKLNDKYNNGWDAWDGVDGFFPYLEELLAPGGISHSGPGENRQFWPDENSQS